MCPRETSDDDAVVPFAAALALADIITTCRITSCYQEGTSKFCWSVNKFAADGRIIHEALLQFAMSMA